MDDDLSPAGHLATESERPGWRGRLARLAVDVRPLRASREFRLLWGGQVVSEFGSRITLVAIPYQVFVLTNSTLAVGLVSLAELGPLLLFALVGGTIADAVDRRRMLLATESTVALTSAGLLVNALLPTPRVWLLFLLAALSTAGFSLSGPAMRSLVPGLVPEEDMPAAMALEGLYGNFAAVAGPAAGGVLIAAIGLPATYGLDVATFAASLATIALLPSFPPAHDAGRASVRTLVEGLRFVRRTPVLLGIFLVDTNAMVFGMPSALFPAVARDHFHAGAAVTGYLFAAPYAGALVASLLSGWTGRIRRQGLVVAVAAASWGAALVGFGYATALWLALLMLVVAGGADMISAIFRSTILFAASPERMRGRLSGIELAQVASAPTLGNVEAGLVASLASVRFSIVSGGLACVVGTVVVGLATPALLRYDASRPHSGAASA